MNFSSLFTTLSRRSRPFRRFGRRKQQQIEALEIRSLLTTFGAVENLADLDYSLQNYFSAGGELTPFFDQLDGTVGDGVEINDSYIYDINLSARAITMLWNTDAEYDLYEPYVGAAGGLTQEQAAAAGVADEYHFTFDTPVSHLVPTVSAREAIQPNVRFEDTHTLVISLPGGTSIGDGRGLQVFLGEQAPVESIDGLDYRLQNYFNAGGDLAPFFDQLNGAVRDGVEIDGGYIYDIDLGKRSITMEWNTDAEFDIYEPYVGAAGGLTQEQAAAAGIADEYHFTFDAPVSHLLPTVSTQKEIQPQVRFEDAYTVVIAIPGGTTIGDGNGLQVRLIDPTPVETIDGLDFSLQNYFNAAGDLTPFFDQQDGTVKDGAEITDDYIYDINLSGRSITMEWNTDAEFDIYEPYVGAAGGLTQEQAAAAGITDEYHFTFDLPVSHLVPVVSATREIQPEVRFEDAFTLVIAIPGGTAIGDGNGLQVQLNEPVASIANLDFSLQNYFNAGGQLTPFFEQQQGAVGGGVEINDGYIYDINLSERAITMEWNTDPEFDIYEPYVGALGGLSPEQAAAAGVADEYHFTFDTPISHLIPAVSTRKEIQPEVRFLDPFTLVIAIPGGTPIGDGRGLQVFLNEPEPILSVDDLELFHGLAMPVVDTVPDNQQRPTITWSEVSNATQYEVRIRDAAGQVVLVSEVVSSTSFTPQNDICIGNVEVSVRALKGSLRSAWSNVQLLQNSQFPGEIQATRTGTGGRVTVEWDAVANAATYRVWVNNLTSGNSPIVVSDLTATSFTLPEDSGVSTLRIWVQAQTSSGFRSQWSSSLRSVAAPVLDSIVASTVNRRPTFTWESLAGASEYEVWISNFGGPVTATVSQTSFTPNVDLSYGSHRWWVRGVDSQGRKSVWSQRGNDINIGAPVIVSAPTISGGTATINWSLMDSATQYTIQVNRIDGDQPVRIAREDVSGTTFQLSGLESSGRYRIWVQAISGSGVRSKWSVATDFVVD